MTRERLMKELDVYSVVFVGKVTGFEYRSGDPRRTIVNEVDDTIDWPRLSDKRDTRWVEFSVEKWWKLPLATTTYLITDQWRLPNGNLAFSSCDYRWKLGIKYLVYAKGRQDLLTANFQSWTIPLSAADEHLRILGEGQVPMISQVSRK